MRATMSADGISRFTVKVSFRVGYSELYAVLARKIEQNVKWPRTKTRLIDAVRDAMASHGDSITEGHWDITPMDRKRIELYLWKMVPEIRKEIEHERALARGK